MSTALLERAFAQAAQLPEELQNTIAALVLELAAQAPTNAAKRRAAVDAAYGSLAHLPPGFDFLDEKHAEVARENGGDAL